MPLPLSPNTGLGMKRNCLAILAGRILDDILEFEQVVRRLSIMRSEPQVDLCLTGSGHLMVLAFHVHPHLLHRQHHLTTDVLLTESVGGTGK